jgi:hypothetical protein
MVELRTFIVLDSLQRQMASFGSNSESGFYPEAGQASCIVEISPGIEINRLTDIALKTTAVMPGLQVVERDFGVLEVHADSQADVREAGRAMLDAAGLDESMRLAPRILTSQLIKNVAGPHAQLINKVRGGNMVVEGDTVYILDIQPAAYAYYAANEAEKVARIKIINVDGIGKYGRVYIAGEEAEVLESKNAVERCLAAIDGRAM